MYLLSILAIIICILAISYVGPGLSLYSYVDVYSFLFLVILSVPVLISSGLLKDLNNAFRLVIGKRAEATLLELKRALLAVKITIKVIIYGGIMLMLLQMVVLLHQMSDPATLGPSISAMLLTFLYAMIFSILLLPIKAKLEIKILEYIQPDKENEMALTETGKADQIG